MTAGRRRQQNGQRRPTLDLLLLLLDAHRVPIDDVVGAPPVGVQAWNIVHASAAATAAGLHPGPRHE